MARPREPKEKEKSPKTRPMPLDKADDFTDWAKKQRKPAPDDKGEKPPDPPKDTKEPREHGAEKPDEEE